MTDKPTTDRVKKRSVNIGGHATSISIEDAFWLELKGMARRQKCTLGQLVSNIDARQEMDDEESPLNLSSTLRLAVLRDLQERLSGNS